jgi:hypothetical protein
MVSFMIFTESVQSIFDTTMNVWSDIFTTLWRLYLENRKTRKWKRKQRMWMKTWMKIMSDLRHNTLPKTTLNLFTSHHLFKRKTPSW